MLRVCTYKRAGGSECSDPAPFVVGLFAGVQCVGRLGNLPNGTVTINKYKWMLSVSDYQQELSCY